MECDGVLGQNLPEVVLSRTDAFEAQVLADPAHTCPDVGVFGLVVEQRVLTAVLGDQRHRESEQDVGSLAHLAVQLQDFPAQLCVVSTKRELAAQHAVHKTSVLLGHCHKPLEELVDQVLLLISVETLDLVPVDGGTSKSASGVPLQNLVDEWSMASARLERPDLVLEAQSPGSQAHLVLYLMSDTFRVNLIVLYLGWAILCVLLLDLLSID